MKINLFPIDSEPMEENPFDLFEKWINVAKRIVFKNFWFSTACLSIIGLDGFPDS